MDQAMLRNWLEADSPAGNRDLTYFEGAHLCNSFEDDVSSRMDEGHGWQFHNINNMQCSGADQERIGFVSLLASAYASAAQQSPGHVEDAPLLSGRPHCSLVPAILQVMERRNQQLHAPLARRLELNSGCPAAVTGAVPQAPATPTTSATYPFTITEHPQQQLQEPALSHGQQQLQQWLARQETLLLVKSARAGAQHSRNSSGASSSATFSNPTDEMMQLLPPPAFDIMGLLG